MQLQDGFANQMTEVNNAFKDQLEVLKTEVEQYKQMMTERETEIMAKKKKAVKKKVISSPYK